MFSITTLLHLSKLPTHKHAYKRAHDTQPIPTTDGSVATSTSKATALYKNHNLLVMDA